MFQNKPNSMISYYSMHKSNWIDRCFGCWRKFPNWM